MVSQGYIYHLKAIKVREALSKKGHCIKGYYRRLYNLQHSPLWDDRRAGTFPDQDDENLGEVSVTKHF